MRTLVILMSLSIVIYLVLKGSREREFNTYDFLIKKYNGTFDTNTYKIGNNLITFAHSKSQEIQHIVTQDPDSDEFKSVYEIFINELNNSPTSYIDVVQIVKANLDSDSEEEIFAEYQTSFGGSAGIVGFVIFDQKDDDIVPLAGGPFRDDTRHLTLMNKTNRARNSYSVYGTADYSVIADLNNDGREEWLHAVPYWDMDDPTESHYSAHLWDLSLYELSGGKMIQAKWWNDGKTYRTKEKYGIKEENMTNLYKEFYLKVRSEKNSQN